MGETLQFEQIYSSLNGMIALQVAATTPLRRQKDEKDTAFVKRIVATYLAILARAQSDDVLKHRPYVNHCSFNCENPKTFEYEGKRYCSYCWCNFARLTEISGSL